MAIPSRFQSLALPILVSDPLWFSPRRGYIESLTNQVSNYQHTISNQRGYDAARFQIDTNLNNAEDWYMFGIGRHLKVNDESQVRAWEGFVNKVTFRVGTTTITVGPLLEVDNKVATTYSTIDTSTEPPTLGIRETTAFAEDADSQAKYAIFEEIISQGGSTATLAEQIRDKGLIDKKDPPRSNDDNFQQVAQPSVRIDCLGYYYFLNAYLYNNTGVTGDENISTKIQNILAADPNNIFSTDYSQITTNTIQVQQYENDNARAKTLIEDLIGMGDTSDNRYNFMVLKDRRVTYEAVSLTTGYVFRLADRSRILEDTVGNRIRPWAAMPGRWRKIPDLLVGRSAPSDIRTDLRQAFIVKTTFTAPNGLRLTSDELEELPQLLGKVSGGGANKSMSYPNAAEWARNLTTYFIRNDDIINRWGNVISSYQNLPGLVGFWPMSGVQPSTGYIPNYVPIVSGATNLSLVNNNSVKIRHYNDLIPYADLDGVNQYFSIADNTDLDITGAEDTTRGSWAGVPGLTFGGWFWSDTIGSVRGLFSKAQVAPTNTSYYLVLNANDTVSFVISDTGNLASNNAIGSAGTISQNSWFFVVGRFVPSTSVDIFLSGIKTTSVAGIFASIHSGNAALEIGRVLNSNYFNGRSALNFLSANALPDSLINSLYQQSHVLFGV